MGPTALTSGDKITCFGSSAIPLPPKINLGLAGLALDFNYKFQFYSKPWALLLVIYQHNLQHDVGFLLANLQHDVGHYI